MNYIDGIIGKLTIYKRLNIKKWGRFHDDLGTKWRSTPSTYQRYQTSTFLS